MHKILKSRVHLDSSSKGTYVDKLACLGIRRLREMECDDEKNIEVLKSRVNPDYSSKGDMCQKINLFDSLAFRIIGVHKCKIF